MIEEKLKTLKKLRRVAWSRRPRLGSREFRIEFKNCVTAFTNSWEVLKKEDARAAQDLSEKLERMCDILLSIAYWSFFDVCIIPGKGENITIFKGQSLTSERDG